MFADVAKHAMPRQAQARNMPGKVMTSNFAISEPAVIFNLWNKIKSKNEQFSTSYRVLMFLPSPKNLPLSQLTNKRTTINSM